ncbi:MAG: hypothetical protein U0995_07525 [Erythrobacter sp.]|nr:hypothetical protein [Erythrobacter sp.]
MNKFSIMAATAAAMIATAAHAEVIFDAETGTGFVGKGDVQLALGLNNKGLQDGTFAFAAVTETVTEVSWTCTNSNNENTQERARATTSSIQGVVSATARFRNQITGFTLNGYDGSETSTTSTEGNPLNSCPSGPWSLTTAAGEPEVVSRDSTLTVNGVPL